MRAEAETGIVRLRSPGAIRSWKRGEGLLSQTLRRQRNPANTLILDFRPLNRKRISFCSFNPPAGGNLLQKFQEMNTAATRKLCASSRLG